MNSDIPNEATDFILRGNKIGAIAVIRKEMNCSLKEAKELVDEFDQDLGTLRVEKKETTKEREPSYRVPWGQHLISLIAIKKSFGIPRALRLSKKYGINTDYHTLLVHAMAGGNPNLVIKEMCNAINEGLQPELNKLFAVDLTFQSKGQFKTWVKNGMSEPVDSGNS